MPLQATMLEPLAMFVVPVGQVNATALEVYTPGAATYAVITVGDAKNRTRRRPGQYVAGAAQSAMSLTLVCVPADSA
jgi:hypothetical protein